MLSLLLWITQFKRSKNIDIDQDKQEKINSNLCPNCGEPLALITDASIVSLAYGLIVANLLKGGRGVKRKIALVLTFSFVYLPPQLLIMLSLKERGGEDTSKT
jgi:hypothetical protein